MRYAAITGWGMAVPERVLTDADLEKMVDTSDEWIVSRTGIKERHVVGPNDSTTSLAVSAARKGARPRGLTADDIDLIIVGTCTPDQFLVSQACLVQAELGGNAGAFDLGAACSGFVYALSTGSQFVQTGAYDRILVIGADTLTPICRLLRPYDLHPVRRRRGCVRDRSIRSTARSCSRPFSEPTAPVTSTSISLAGVRTSRNSRYLPGVSTLPPNEWQRSLQVRCSRDGRRCGRSSRAGRSRVFRYRHADPASSQSAHHRRGRTSTRSAARSRLGQPRSLRQHLCCNDSDRAVRSEAAGNLKKATISSLSRSAAVSLGQPAWCAGAPKGFAATRPVGPIG